MSDLADKSLTEVRQIAQNLGIPDVFVKEQKHLIQEIGLRQSNFTEFPVPQVVTRMQDIRMLTEAPNAIVAPTEIMDALRPYMARGVHVHFEGEHWFASLGKKEDSGTIRMPLRDIVACVEKILR